MICLLCNKESTQRRGCPELKICKSCCKSTRDINKITFGADKPSTMPKAKKPVKNTLRHGKIRFTYWQRHFEFMNEVKRKKYVV